MLELKHWDAAKKDFTDEWKYTVEDAATAGMQYVISPWLDDELRASYDAMRSFADVFNKSGELCNKYGMKFGYHNHNYVALVERVTDHIAKPSKNQPRERLWQVRAKRVVIASGSIERHMVFANNDRPGIMLASAARTYLNHFGVAVGAKVGVYTAHDSAYEAAIDLKKSGVSVPVIVDAREKPGEGVMAQARALGI